VKELGNGYGKKKRIVGYDSYLDGVGEAVKPC